MGRPGPRWCGERPPARGHCRARSYRPCRNRSTPRHSLKTLLRDGRGEGHSSTSGAGYNTYSASDLLAEIDLVGLGVRQLVIHATPASLDSRHRGSDQLARGRFDHVHGTIQRLEVSWRLWFVRVADRETAVKSLLAQQLNSEVRLGRALIVQGVARELGEPRVVTEGVAVGDRRRQRLIERLGFGHVETKRTDRKSKRLNSS